MRNMTFGGHALPFMLALALGAMSFPTTGQALPFISAGGSSMVIFLAAMGVLLNISRSTSGSMRPILRAAFRRRKAPAKKESAPAAAAE